MAGRRYVAFDLGAGSGRTVVGSLDGDRLAMEVVDRFGNEVVEMPDGAHWATAALQRHLETGLQKAAAAGPIESCAVDTWGVDFGLLDSSGRLLGLPFAYRDRRHQAAMDRALSAISEAELYAATGIRPMFLNTVFQLAAYRHEQPRLLELADRLLFTPDLMAYLLSGEAGCELSIASTSGLLDPGTRGWHAGVFGALELPQRLMLPPRDAGYVLGPIRGDVQDRTRCGPAKLVATCGHDTACAVAAVPASGDDWCYISSGTWSLMGVELDSPVLTETSRLAGFTNEIGLGGKVRYLRNIAGLWLLQEAKRHWDAQGQSLDWSQIVSEAEAVSEPVAVIDPDHPSFAATGPMVPRLQAFARATNQPEPQSVGEVARCCLQALALRYRDVVDNLEAVTGRPIRTIHIVGGGGQNALLNRFAADCCQRAVVVGPTEATAMGNLLVQALAMGELGSPADVRSVVRASVEPQTVEPGDVGSWDEQFGRFKEMTANPPTLAS